MIKSKKLSLRLATLLAITLTSTAQAQDVYNFYFQKAPGSVVTPTPTVVPQPQTSLVPAATAAAPPAAPVTQTAVVTAAIPASTEEKPKFYNWNVQLMRTSVADAYSDVVPRIRDRLGLEAGYRFNKFFAATAGMAFGSIYSNWKAETGTEVSNSFIPYGGIRINPLHLNIFGTEMLEIFAHAGVMYGALRSPPYGPEEPDAQLYAYFGGGARINFGDRIGLEFSYRTKNDDSRYGVGSIGVDVRL